ncbi:unnamed protein product [Merluccius merluccius]
MISTSNSGLFHIGAERESGNHDNKVVDVTVVLVPSVVMPTTRCHGTNMADRSAFPSLTRLMMCEEADLELLIGLPPGGKQLKPRPSKQLKPRPSKQGGQRAAPEDESQLPRGSPS